MSIYIPAAGHPIELPDLGVANERRLAYVPLKIANMPKKLHALALLLSLGWAPQLALGDVSGWSVALSPGAPISLEPVYARIANTTSCTIDPQKTTVRQDGTTISITTQLLLNGCIPTGAGSRQDVSLGQLQAGIFTVVVRDGGGLQLTSTQFQVTEAQPNRSVPTPLVDYSDLWWNPQESGWGLNITQHAPGRLFATWVTYDDGGNATWFSLQPGSWNTPTSYAGPIFRTTGPSFRGSFDPARVSLTQVGSGTLTFDGPSSGVFSYNISGTSGSRHIERIGF